MDGNELMTAGEHRPVDNWEFTQGDDVRRSYGFYESDGVTAVTITGRTFAASMRPEPSDGTVTTFTVATSTSTIELQLTDTVSAALAPGRYVYAIKQTIGSVTTTIIAGQITVLEDVTA